VNSTPRTTKIAALCRASAIERVNSALVAGHEIAIPISVCGPALEKIAYASAERAPPRSTVTSLKKAQTAVVAALMMSSAAMADSEDVDFDIAYFNAGWVQVHVGMTGASVVRRLGQAPRSEEITKTIAGQFAHLHWRVGDAAYRVTLFAGHVIAAKKCTPATAGQC
jgi:hypothetical protein